MNLVLLLFLCRLAWPGLISYKITYKNSELILLYNIFGQIMVVCISKIQRKNYFLQIQNSNTVKKYNFLYGFSINTFLNFSQECNCFTVLLKYPTFAVGFFIFCQNRLNIYNQLQLSIYHTHAIITCGWSILNPPLKVKSFFSRFFFSENSAFMYG